MKYSGEWLAGWLKETVIKLPNDLHPGNPKENTFALNSTDWDLRRSWIYPVLELEAKLEPCCGDGIVPKPIAADAQEVGMPTGESCVSFCAG